jgi:Tfp pilus assembly protein FimT
MSRLRSQNGFSLLEMGVAIGMTSIVLATALPRVSTALGISTLRSAARSTAAHVRLTRALAISRNVQSRVAVANGGTTLTSEVSSDGTTWTTGSAPLTLPAGTTAALSPSISFQPSGIANSPATITLQNDGGSIALGLTLLGVVDAS